MVHAITLTAGRARYRNRWVRTARFAAEAAAGQRLGVLTGTDNGRANTHVLPHAGRLLALEEAHAPVVLCPDTLRTFDEPMDHAVAALPFTAHPKRDPRTGDWCFLVMPQRVPYHVKCAAAHWMRPGASPGPPRSRLPTAPWCMISR